MTGLESISFPSLPEFEAVWTAVYLEPVVGSGERITVAAAAVSNNSGEFKVIQAIREEVLECLYQSKAPQIQEMIDWTVSSLSKHLKSTANINSWIPPFAGVYSSASREAQADNIEGILEQSIEFSSGLNYIAHESESDEYELKKHIRQDDWVRDVRDEVVKKNDAMKGFFNFKMNLNQTNVITTFAFISPKYSANLALIRSRSIANNVNYAKFKLFDLNLLKNKFANLGSEKYELIVGAPNMNTLDIPKATKVRIRENIQSLKYSAKDCGVEVFVSESAHDAATRIIDLAA